MPTTGNTPKSGLADLDDLVAPSRGVPLRENSPSNGDSSQVAERRSPATSTPMHRRPKRLRPRSQVFYLTDPQIETLERIARETERSKSELVRELIERFAGEL